MPEKTLNVAQILIEYLKLEGVTHVFGVPGGGLIDVLDEFYRQRDTIEYVVTRQETGAAYMADGYYRASGKLGVIMVTTGPSATNALTGVMNAEAAGSALLAVTGEIAKEYTGMGFLQEGIDGKLDVNQVYRASCGFSTIVSSGVNAQRLIEASLRTAKDVPRHASHLSLPLDVAAEPAVKLSKPGTPPEPVTIPDSPTRYRSAAPEASSQKVERALDILISAKRPLIMLGNGCRQALRDPATLDALIGFVESQGIPVMTTANAKGLFPEDHPLSLRCFGIANSIWPYYWMSQDKPTYDTLLVVGSALGELATNRWNPILRPQGPIVQVDANQRMIGRNFPVEIGIVGEAGAFINSLARLSGETAQVFDEAAERKAMVATIKDEHSAFFSDEEYNSTSVPVQPAALCRVMQNSLPAENTIIMQDAGNCVGWGTHYLISKPGFEVHASLGMGPMGFASGAVIGAKIACPDSTCVAFTGDGAFMMQGSEVSTAQRNGIGAIWVVLQDDDLSMVSRGMEHYKEGDAAIWEDMFSLGEPDLEKYASGLGADAYTVDSPESFEVALKTAVTKADTDKIPQVIIAKIARRAEPPYYNPLYAKVKTSV